MKRKKAFTLVELILVIAVSGVLVTFGGFALHSMREAGRDRIADEKREILAAAALAYELTHGVHVAGDTPEARYQLVRPFIGTAAPQSFEAFVGDAPNITF